MRDKYFETWLMLDATVTTTVSALNRKSCLNTAENGSSKPLTFIICDIYSYDSYEYQ